MSAPTDDKKTMTRRKALKTLAAVTGAATLASLPGRWESPQIEVGALPAHAATSVFSISNLRYEIFPGERSQDEDSDVTAQQFGSIVFNYFDPAAIFGPDTAYLYAALVNCGTTLFDWEPLDNRVSVGGTPTNGYISFLGFHLSNACINSLLCVQLSSAGRKSNELCKPPINAALPF